MKKSTATIFLISLLLAACREKSETIKPTFSRLNEAVYASGRILSNGQYTIYSPVTGLLLEILAEEGDTIRAGDPLFLIDNKTLELNSDNARLALELSRENSQSGSDKLRELDLASQTAKEKYDLDSSLFSRQKKLWEQGIGSRIEYEQKELALIASRNAYLTTNAKLSDVKKQLRNDLGRAENNYSITQKQQNDYTIRSLIDGVVFDISKERGELISPQSPMGVIGDASFYKLELEVDEYDIVRIVPGQKVEITMDSRRGQVYEAVVVKILPLMNERTRSFVVEAVFTNPPPSLFPNLTVEANIIIQTKEKALTIPREYLVDNQYVYVGKDEKRSVKIGLRDFNKVEILEGIDSSEVLVKPKAP